uniref:Tn3 family transposase n=1 Tax=Streptomyces sp. f51 TaxID=1827742 RepID=UPI00403FF1F8
MLRHLRSRQLTVQESPHRLARVAAVAGVRSAMRAPGQGDQLAALGLVLSALVQWNTCYLDAAAPRPAECRREFPACRPGGVNRE